MGTDPSGVLIPHFARFSKLKTKKKQTYEIGKKLVVEELLSVRCKTLDSKKPSKSERIVKMIFSLTFPCESFRDTLSTVS